MASLIKTHTIVVTVKDATGAVIDVRRLATDSPEIAKKSVVAFLRIPQGGSYAVDVVKN